MTQIETSRTVRGNSTSSKLPKLYKGPSNTGLVLYILLLLFTLLSIPSRLPILGALRPTLILVFILIGILGFDLAQRRIRLNDKSSKWLFGLSLYVLLTVPLVKWPGSLIHNNLAILVTSFSFFFFTVAFVNTERKLQWFLAIYVSAQLFRIFHPLVLHLTQGYWGDRTYLGDEVGFIPRLSGGPGDIINSNGLASLVLLVFPFVYFWSRCKSFLFRCLIAYPIIVASVYVLMLTLSRSALVGLAIEGLIVSLMSKYRVILLAAMCATVIVGAAALSDLQLERFESLVRSDAKGADTAKGRVTSIYDEVKLFYDRPVFGYGFGTSYEALTNLNGTTTRSHTLYTEVLLEIGLVGLYIYLGFLASIWKAAVQLFRQRSIAIATTDKEPTASWVACSSLTWIAAYSVYSIASYGLSTYVWYLHGGIIVAASRVFSASSSETLPKSV